MHEQTVSRRVLQRGRARARLGEKFSRGDAPGKQTGWMSATVTQAGREAGLPAGTTPRRVHGHPRPGTHAAKRHRENGRLIYDHSYGSRRLSRFSDLSTRFRRFLRYADAHHEGTKDAEGHEEGRRLSEARLRSAGRIVSRGQWPC